MLVDLLKLADVGITGISIAEDEGARLVARASRRAYSMPEMKIVFMHSSCDDPFEIEDESDGTEAWLGILTLVLTVLDEGGTLVVDEIDTSLHPALTARLLALFQSEETNPKSAQLICTTHDTTLLSPTLGEQVLTRGQVWFTEKNGAGETSLYPLSDFSPRKGENTERRYLGGSYGAVPRVFAEEFADTVRGSRDDSA
jgi:AAA15 family ATPase/GTPase